MFKLKINVFNNNLFNYAKNSIWIISEKLIRIFFSLFIGAWVARYLGPDNFGQLSFAQSFIFLFSSFATLGMANILAKELIEEKYSEKNLLTTSISLSAIASVFMFVLSMLTSLLFDYSQYQILLIFIIASSTPFLALSLIDCYFQSKVQSKYSSIAGMVSLLISGIFRIVLILSNSPPYYFAIAAVLETIITLIGSYYFFIKVSNINIFNRSQFKLSIAIALLKGSWPFMIVGVMISLYMRVDQVMIKNILGDASLGNFAAAVRISEMWYFLPMALISSLYPALVNAKKNNPQLYLSRIKTLFTCIFYMGIAIILIIWFFSYQIIFIIFGSEYSTAGNILAIYVWSGIFVCIGLVNTQWMLTENLQIYAAINSFLGLIINILLNLLLIPHFGLSGAAISTVISYCLSSYIFLFIWKKTRSNFITITKSFFFIPKLDLIFFKR